MAGRATGQQRLREAEALLLERRSPTACVNELADRWQISRRQSRRIVAQALDAIRGDLDEVHRSQMLALLVDAGCKAVAQALELKQPAAAVGAIRCLDQLVGLGIGHSQQVRRWS
jgi:hypothetical protein